MKLAFALLLAGCYDATLADGLPCSESRGCPEGQSCSPGENVCLTEEPPHHAFAQISAGAHTCAVDTDHDLYDAVAMGMFARGAMPEPDSREPWFLCEAHARGDIVDRVVTSFEGSLRAALDARARGEGSGAEPAGAMSHPSAG